MRCLTPFLIIALLALFGLVGYNTWQIGQLRTELASAKAQVAKPADQVSAEKEINKLLEDAKQRTERARDMIAGGQAKNAREELSKSLQKLEKASKLSKDMANSAVRGVTGAVHNIKSKLEGVSGRDDKEKGKK